MPELAWHDLLFYLRSALEIAILWSVLYHLLLALERISAGGKVKGISVFLGALVVALLVARFAQLHAIVWLLQAFIGFSALILIVIFQPELRRLFTRIGGIIPHLEGPVPRVDVTQQIIDGLVQMSARRQGALIVIERSDRLDDYVRTSPIDCELTSRSLQALFWKDAPFHDGAVIVRSGRVVAAGVILPLSEMEDPTGLSGTRHRAALGISEDTDALALVVSEETGSIGIADKGQLRRGITRQELEQLLGGIFGAPVNRRSGILGTIGRRRPRGQP